MLDATAPGATPARPADPDARAIVLDGYARASLAYRGDTFPLEGSAYAYWLSRIVPRIPAGGRVLDLGCGNGVPVARALAPHFEVTGVDLSPVQVERARVLVPAARFVCADMSALDAPAGSFDAVLAFYSLIHLPLAEHAPMLARIAGWLAPGGHVLAVVGQEPWTGVEENWRGVSGARMYYSQAGIARYREWLAAAGLAIVEQGREPRRGNPGYAVLIARAGGASS
ncbi:MAG TPA: class I SAM-dependent methyltransferase [Candidatus Acidoferrales bacterium]|nr:class I SAM-dependent methyltransferase [Candidatus Acidoferrales bacterium]